MCMVTLKVLRKWPLKLGNVINRRRDTVKCCQKMYFQKRPKSYKNSLTEFRFALRYSKYGPYEEDFANNFNNFYHYMPFLSINLFKLNRILDQLHNKNGNPVPPGMTSHGKP